MIVDFSEEKPEGKGIYPGGQSGNPFSRHYDDQIKPYLEFHLFQLIKPHRPEQMPRDQRASETRLIPES